MAEIRERMKRTVRENNAAAIWFFIVMVLIVVGLSFSFSNALATGQNLPDRAIQYWVSQLSQEQLTSSRHAAQERLEQFGAISIDPLITALRSSNPVLRRNSAEMLGYIASPKAAQPLHDALLNDPDPAVRRQAAVSLSQLDTIQVVPWLERAAGLDREPAIREGAAEALDAMRMNLAAFAGRDARQATAFAVAPTASNIVYLAEMGDVLASQDGGKTWRAAGAVPSRIDTLVVSQSSPSTVYAGTESMGLYKTTDGGATWQPMNNGLGLEPGATLSITAIAVDPDDPNRVYAAKGYWIGTSQRRLFPQGIVKSVDGGTTWQPLPLPAVEVAITRMTLEGSQLYVVTGDRLIAIER